MVQVPLIVQPASSTAATARAMRTRRMFGHPLTQRGRLISTGPWLVRDHRADRCRMFHGVPQLDSNTGTTPVQPRFRWSSTPAAGTGIPATRGGPAGDERPLPEPAAPAGVAGGNLCRRIPRASRCFLFGPRVGRRRSRRIAGKLGPRCLLRRRTTGVWGAGPPRARGGWSGHRTGRTRSGRSPIAPARPLRGRAPCSRRQPRGNRGRLSSTETAGWQQARATTGTSAYAVQITRPLRAGE